MVHQCSLVFYKWWVCFEWHLSWKPIYGKDVDFIYFYWLIGGIQIGKATDFLSQTQENKKAGVK